MVVGCQHVNKQSGNLGSDSKESFLTQLGSDKKEIEPKYFSADFRSF